MGAVQVKEILENPEASATVLHTICLRDYGEDWYMWDPSSLYLELKEDYFADPPAENMDKLSAVQVLIASDTFFKDPDAFFAICTTLANSSPLFNIFAPPTMEEIAWSVAEVALHRELLPYARAIKKSVEAIGGSYGFNKNRMPIGVKEMFSTNPDEDVVQEAFGAILNGENIEKFMQENLMQMQAQFESDEKLASLFPHVIEKGVIPAVQELG